MGKWETILRDILSGERDNGIRFDDLCGLLERKGFVVRIRGSHRWYQRGGFAPLNLQPAGGMAKPYQVRQVRRVLKDGGER